MFRVRVWNFARLLFPFNLRDTLFWSWKIFWHCTAKILDCLANLLTDLIMRVAGSLLAAYVFTAKFFVCLRGAEKVCCEFCASHMIENLLTLFQTFPCMYFFCAKTTIKPLIATILEDGIVAWVNNTGHLRGFGERLIVRYHFTPNGKALLIFRKLIVIVN